MLNPPLARPVPEYAKSSLYVARHQMDGVGGDLALAQEYLERIAASNSEEVGQAIEMLKKIKASIAATSKVETLPIGGPHSGGDVAEDESMQ